MESSIPNPRPRHGSSCRITCRQQTQIMTTGGSLRGARSLYEALLFHYHWTVSFLSSIRLNTHDTNPFKVPWPVDPTVGLAVEAVHVMAPLSASYPRCLTSPWTPRLTPLLPEAPATSWRDPASWPLPLPLPFDDRDMCPRRPRIG